jgi:peptidoglycan/xylan/chitin deacetylase (PgdA/CDA1 family)
VVERGTSGRREIALTFDAGSDRGNAEEILDLLAGDRIAATFGMTGLWAEANPDLVRRMVEEGHDLINHSWSHPSFTGASTGSDPLPAADRRRELRSTERFIRDLTGYDTRPYFRPPYGDLDDSVLADIAAVDYTVTVLWSCDSLGWDGAAPEDIVARCGAAASPGDIVLLHLGSDSTDLAALPGLIENLANEEYAFVTVSKLLAG